MQHLQIATTPENTPAKPKPTPIVIANPRNISLPPVILDLSVYLLFVSLAVIT
jgi:hypothetical protein